MCHLAPENSLPHEGHASSKSVKRRSGAHTNTLGCNARLCTSSLDTALPPSLRLRTCTAAALRVRSAGRTQGSPASSRWPSSMRRVTASTAVLAHAAPESAPAAAPVLRSAAVGDGAPSGLAKLTLSCRCSDAVGSASCDRALLRSMSRTDSVAGSRCPVGATEVAAHGSAPALHRGLIPAARDGLLKNDFAVANGNLPKRCFCKVFLTAGRPLLTHVLCRSGVFAGRRLLVAMQILAADGIFGATFRVGEAPSAIENRRFAMAGEN